jgi:hypothetical protein
MEGVFDGCRSSRPRPRIEEGGLYSKGDQQLKFFKAASLERFNLGIPVYFVIGTDIARWPT